MRKHFLLLAALLFSAGMAYSQKKIEVSESSENIGGGRNNALTVMIYHEDVDAIEKAWKSRMKDLGGKNDTKNGEIFSDECKSKDMGANTFDVYAKFVPVKGEGVKLIVGVDLGGAFLSSSGHGAQYKVFKQIVYDFAMKNTKDKLAAAAKVEEEKLDDLNKEQKKLESDNTELKEDIEEYKKKIAEAEQKIKENEVAQEAKKKEIEAQQKVTEVAKEKLNGVK